MTQTTPAPASIDAPGRVLPPRSVLAAAATGLGVASWLPGSEGPGIFLLIVALLAGLAILFAGSVPINRRTVGFGLAGALLVAMTSIRSAVWLVAPDLLLALVLAALAVSDPAGWREALLGVLSPAARLPQTPGSAFRSASAAAGSADPGRVVRLVRAVLMGGVLVAVFWALFASADPAFAQLTDRVLPDWDLGLLPARIVVFAIATAVTLAFVLAGVAGAPKWLGALAAPFLEVRLKLARTEWVAILGLLNALFLAFAAVQVVVLFQGHDHILRTAGLTYAEYARAGFFQLLAAAGLAIPVLTLTWVHAERSGRSNELALKLLLGCLAVLTLVVVGSALRRLGLYEEAFGFTRQRLAAHGAALWLGAVIVAMLVAGATGRTRLLFYATMAITALTVVGFNLINPDQAIAERNWRRYEQTGKIDADYLSRLSADAVPFIAGLPEEIGRPILQQLGDRVPEDEPWSSANLSRIRAREVLEKAGLNR